MFEVNQKYGSFYLQSKVYRAWEALDQEYTNDGKKTPDDDAAVQHLLHQDAAADAQQTEQQQQPQQSRQ
jgi:import inner membrane translocase subunit TIM16